MLSKTISIGTYGKKEQSIYPKMMLHSIKTNHTDIVKLTIDAKFRHDSKFLF